MKSRTLGSIAAAALLLIVGSSPAMADLTHLGTSLLVGSGTLGEGHPDVAYDNKNNFYLTVWGDGGGGSVRPAYSQLINPSGTMVGARMQLTNCPGETYGQVPKVAYSTGAADDVFLAFYREVCGSTTRLWVQLLKSTPNGVASIGRVVVDGAGTPGGVAYNPQKGEFFVVWEKYTNKTTEYDVYGKAIPLARTNGIVTGFGSLPTTINVAVLAKTQGWPDIAYSPDYQSYLIVFHGENPTTGASSIMERTMDANSYAMSQLLFVVQGSYEVQPAVTYLPVPDKFLVIWREGTDEVARLITPVSGVAAGNIYPMVALPGTDGAGGIGYDSLSGSGLAAIMQDDYWSWGSQFNSNGAVVQTLRVSFATPTKPGGGTFFPQVVGTGGGNLAITYGIDYTKIYFERFSISGVQQQQQPPPPSCTFSVGLTSINVPAASFSGSVPLTTSTTPCSWTATSNASWISVSPGSGTAAASINYTVQSNPSATSGRSGTVTIAGKTFTVNQAKRSLILTDLSGDGKADPMFYRASDGTWQWKDSTTGAVSSITYQGVAGDIPVAGDFDGDGIDDPALFRHSDGCWYILKSTTSTPAFVCWGGNADDIPAPADYDGDGKTDVAFYRPSEGRWYIVQSSTGTARYVNWGGTSGGEQPVPADYDGDGKADIAFYRPSDRYWYILKSSTGTALYIQWGVNSNEIAVPADYDGDGKADPAYFMPNTGYWYIAKSSGGTRTVYWGTGSGDQPVPADYDGDGKADVAFFHAPYFYVVKSTNSTALYITFGAAGDVALTK